MNKRTKQALELRQQGLSFNQIGQDLGIGSERTRQIVRKYEASLESLEDPLKRKIEESNRPGDAKRILNALRGSDCYDGDLMKLANCKPEAYTENKWTGHKKRRCHRQSAGKHGGYRGC